MNEPRRQRPGRHDRQHVSSSRSAKETTNRVSSARRLSLRIRRVKSDDVASIIALDKRITGLAKPDYWEDVFKRYGRRRSRERFFFVAEPLEADATSALLGFIIGEIRAWEFGSGPCGWIFALSVEPNARLRGTGEALFNAISAQFKAAGVTKLRTMVARDYPLPMQFFRGEGMVAGPYIQLEKELG